MGVVYKAEDTTLDRFFAIKFLPLHLSRDDEGLPQFEDARKRLANLNVV